MTALDTTSLKSPIKVHTNCTVIDVSSGAFPRYIEVRMPGPDGARRGALWNGTPALANDDVVICHEIPNSPVLIISSRDTSEDASTNQVNVTKLVSPDLTIDPVLSADNSGDVTLAGTGDLILPEDIVHAGDTDTLISFTANQIDLQAGAVVGLTIGSAEIAVNDGSADLDFRVEGNGDADLIFADAGNDAVVMGSTTVTGNAKLNVYKAVSDASVTNYALYAEVLPNVTGSFTGSQRAMQFLAQANGSGGGSGSLVGLQGDAINNQSSGTLTAANAGSLAVRVIGAGSIGTGYGFRVIPILSAAGALTTWIGVNPRSPAISGAGGITTAYGIWIEAQQVTGVGTGYAVYQQGTSDTNYFGGGIVLGAPTGGNKGTGTLNAAADIYKNNSAYTNPDYVLERYFNGRIKLFEDSDGAADYPGLLPLTKLRAYLAEALHLPGRRGVPMGIFERADLVQRWIEELALYITELHERLEKLENANT